MEAKLSKLITARQSQASTSKKNSFVDELKLCESGDIVNNSEDLDLETSIEVHPLARRLVPEQAITVGEQVVLTKADQLEKEDSESV